ncbi:MAG: AAA family ATPase [Brevinematales bacterium]|nr:AAA family ATPase [Brevinematales bacterium]
MNYFSIEVENIADLRSKLYEEMTKRNISPDRVVILTKRPIRKKGFLGIGSKTVYQVWIQVLDQDNNIQKNFDTLQKQNIQPTLQIQPNDTSSLLHKEIENIKKMIQEVMVENKKIKEITSSYLKAKETNFEMIRKQMSERDFPIGFIEKIIERVDNELTEEEKQNFYTIYDKVKSIIASNIKVASTELVIAKKPKIVVLVGPTGVGKTTTIVKLALQWGASKGKKFVFFSLDKYKAGASFQLKSFAEIFKVAMKSIRNEEELKESLDIFANDVDIIFVDTAGTSQKDTLTINDLKEHIKVMKKYDLWVSLVISAVTKYKDMIDIINRYSLVGYNNIILSKIDETNTLGSSIAALYESQVPLSFVTNGQRVEADITTFRPLDLVYMSLDERRSV